MAKRQSNHSQNISQTIEEQEYVYRSNPNPYKVKNKKYSGLQGNSDIYNSMNKDNMTRYVNAFVMSNLRDGNIKLNREYRNRVSNSGWIKSNKHAIKSYSAAGIIEREDSAE